MADDKRYNGWTNYETWLVKLWIDNEQASQEYWYEQAEFFLNSEFEPAYPGQSKLASARYEFAATLKEHHEEFAPELEGMYADLLGAAMSEVDWHEIAQSLLEGVQEARRAS